MDRREFVKASTAGVALSALGRYPRLFAAERTRRVGLIGAGWYGKSALLRLLQVAPAEVVCLCDVDRNMLANAAELVASRQSGKMPRTYGDYREMLKNEDLDIVQVSTPDHWHALAMIAAVQAGRDVYVEKPICHDVVEGQAMVAAARKYGRVVQVNMQRRSTAHLLEAKKEIIEQGKLGKIAQVEICCYYHMRARGNPPDTTPPAHLNWDMWTGPAPLRPYNSVAHPRSWRAFTEYSNGIVGDMCVHMLDTVRWMMGLGWPQRISSSGGIFVETESKANTTDTQTATFSYDDLNVVWQHRSWGEAPDKAYPWAMVFYGEKGTLKADVRKYDFIPRGKGKPIHRELIYELDKYPEDKTERDLEKHVAPAMRAHWLNFLECVDNRSKPVSNIEEGYITAASCILANIAQRVGRTLTWDPVAGRVVGDDQANGLLKKTYRSPWVHPELGNV